MRAMISNAWKFGEIVFFAIAFSISNKKTPKSRNLHSAYAWRATVELIRTAIVQGNYTICSI